MRFSQLTIAVAALLALAAPARAQHATCHPVSPTDRVTVTTASGASIRGTLLCLTDTAILLARDGQTREMPLAEIRRIETTADPVWDGAVKGAAIPLVFWAIFCHGCDGGEMLKAASAYGLIGLTWDAAQGNRKTIYAVPGRSAYTRAGRTTSIAWRVRF